MASVHVLFINTFFSSAEVDVVFEEPSYTANETSGTVMVCVVKNGLLARPIALQLSTTPGSAQETADFTPTQLIVETTLPRDCIEISITADDLVETPEIFSVEVTNINSDPAVNILQPEVEILINDSSTVSVVFSMSAYAGDESDGVEVCAMLQGDTDREVTVSLELDDSCESRMVYLCTIFMYIVSSCILYPPIA